jgi:hypothetical protein
LDSVSLIGSKPLGEELREIHVRSAGADATTAGELGGNAIDGCHDGTAAQNRLTMLAMLGELVGSFDRVHTVKPAKYSDLEHCWVRLVEETTHFRGHPLTNSIPAQFPCLGSARKIDAPGDTDTTLSDVSSVTQMLRCKERATVMVTIQQTDRVLTNHRMNSNAAAVDADARSGSRSRFFVGSRSG